MSLFCAFFAAFQKLQKICLLSTVLFSPLCCGLSSRREAELHEGSFTQVSKILAVWLEYQTVQTKSQGSKCVAKESFIGKALPSAISSSASWQRLAPPSWWSRRARWSPSHGWMKDIGRNRYHWAIWLASNDNFTKSPGVSCDFECAVTTMGNYCLI